MFDNLIFVLKKGPKGPTRPEKGHKQAHAARGFMQRICRTHFGQPLTAEAVVGQLCALHRVARQVCAGIRIRTKPACGRCGTATATRALILGDVVPGTRRVLPGSRRRQQPVPAHQGSTADEAAAQRDPTRETSAEDQQDASAAAVRKIRLNSQSRGCLAALRFVTPPSVPVAVVFRFAVAWTESLEVAMCGNEVCGLMSRYRARLLLASMPEGVDRNEELKRRSRLWERGEMDELVRRVAGQQLRCQSGAPGTIASSSDQSDDEEAKGKCARAQVAVNSMVKAMKGCVGGVASGSPQER